jgi:hypothetical protein
MMKKYLYAGILIIGCIGCYLIYAQPLNYRRRYIISDGQYGFPPVQGIQYTPHTTGQPPPDEIPRFIAGRGVKRRVQPEYDPTTITIYRPKRVRVSRVLEEEKK